MNSVPRKYELDVELALREYQEAAKNRVVVANLAQAMTAIQAATVPTLIVLPPLSLYADDRPQLEEVVGFGRTKAVIVQYDEADLIRKRGSTHKS